LIGFMGVGKSTVGRSLAALLAQRFVDTDELVATTAGALPEIFAERGEAGFRALERDVVVKAVAAALTEPAVLALGGGAVLSGDVREALARLGHVAWLTAPVDVLWRRVAGSGLSARPLARDREGFERLLREREAVYRSVATLTVASDGTRPPETVAREVQRRVAGHGDREWRDHTREAGSS
jgi:shikimate kinase